MVYDTLKNIAGMHRAFVTEIVSIRVAQKTKKFEFFKKHDICQLYDISKTYDNFRKSEIPPWTLHYQFQFYKGIRPKIQRKYLHFSFLEIF